MIEAYSSFDRIKPLNPKVQNIHIDGIRVEQVQNFKYLGTLVSSSGRVEEDINYRLNCAGRLFNAIKTVFF